jgi:hypothetical protein
MQFAEIYIFARVPTAAIGPEGRVEWRLPVGAIHDLHLLPDGHILYQDGWTRIVELDEHRKPIWDYNAKRNGNAGRTVEVHAFQRLPDGNTLLVNCHAGRDNPQIIEVTPDKKVVWSFRDFETFGDSMPVAVVLEP